MNGKQSKRLRRIARGLKLNPKSEYAPMGTLRRVPDRTIIDRQTGAERVLKGGLIRRPFALKACERRAYQEAKALYRGAEAMPGKEDLAELRAAEKPFKTRMVDSMRKQPDGPVAQ